ncbi:hypothetical protein DNK59_21255 [Pseudomonas sp. TKO26]|uniref:Uncharacterized protein n=1 Tax=Pseudomonas saponiphila TaxID=556534 RepID=A0A1H4P900_9PSED|nr:MULTISPECIES: hypothetical protein [Pseudomonas]PYY82879.1 hypothetical protein DNK62_21255 [Pseudomonas sp. TKO30]PYY84293.1 hypothetical protein DNK61_20630 [Pseudomonas sp. TKO29]PYY86643.1 hypothetical protein DNK59_21255 [Pseudomonas sp. TKO26]PYY98223.1 hypothetical protein DNK60_22105 [Pseudomonas sp. TKO14]SEC03900.1 hypothetical protein SAMN05216178_3206 [Pseudomonas saponiphila]
MNRQDALNILWKRLFIIFVLLLAASLVAVAMADGYTIPSVVFIVGNIGGYVGFHRQLSHLSEEEVVSLCRSWFNVLLPSFIGGILAGLLYILFISGVVQGELFPQIVSDKSCRYPDNSFYVIFCQHADGYAAYGKLLFWSFVAGFNQNYVVDLIENIKGSKKAQGEA